jgi:beta-phosphoglucomutase-like phosphatase (HAD superfamily)
MPVARAVAFDFNGTLSDDEPLMYAIYREMFGARGRPITEAEYYGQLAGLTEEAIIAGWLGVDGEELEELVRERVGRYISLAGDGATIDGDVRDAVAYAAARVPVAVVSGAFRREIEPVLRAAGLAGHVRTLVAADDVEQGKPSPEAYALAVALLGDGLEPGDVVAFEDTEAGVTAAKDGGLRCVAVRGTVAPSRLARADEIVDRIDTPLMRRLLG